MSETLLQVENLRTYFHTFRGVVKAVDGVSFSLDEGQVLGIVGESGSGKSVSSFSILKLIEPPGVVESDKILFRGEDISKKSEKEMMKIRGKEISMVFQDPMTSLNPLYTIEKQITEMLDLHQKLIRVAAREGRPLSDYFLDGLHMNEEGNRAIAEAAAPALRKIMER
jgi:ABC-type dipeptide/oligopeptide/nickel transport system ATPase component